MPTIIREGGFRLFFYSDEGILPHVHVQYQGRTAKFWINPIHLAYNRGLNASELSKSATLIKKHEKLIQEKWNEFFSKKS